MNTLQLVTTSSSAHYQEQLRALDQNGINYEVISSYQSGIHEDNNLVSTFPTSLQKAIYFGISGIDFYRKVLQKTTTNKYDIVHATSGLVAPFALAQPIRPVIISFWGSDVLGDYFGGNYLEVCRWCAQHADAVSVPSERVMEKLGTDTYIIPHSIDLNQFRPMDQDECQRELGWDPNLKHVLFPYSSERKVKRFELAKEVVAIANRLSNRNIQLQVVANEPHARIPIYMNAANVLLLTSKHESQPLTVKEAIGCNLPVVSVDVGDVREYVSDVEPSIVCDSEIELPHALLKVLKKESRSDGRVKMKGELQFSTFEERIVAMYDDVVFSYRNV